MNCQKKRGNYQDSHDFSMPAECTGYKCRHCFKGDSDNFIDKHEIINGGCMGTRCKNCDNATSLDFSDVHMME